MNNPDSVDDAEERSPTPGDFPPRRNRGSSVPTFLFISLILFMLTNNRGEELDARYHFLRAMDSLNRQVADYSAWMNGTASNFSLPTQDLSTIPLVNEFMTFGSKLNPANSSYYTNLTGFWHGETTFNNLTSPEQVNASAPSWAPLAVVFAADVNMSALPGLLGSWDWAASNKISLSVGDKLLLPTDDVQDVPGGIATIHGKVELTDPNAPEDLRLDFEGVHFISNGSIYAFAEPAGRGTDLRTIPSLVPPDHMNNAARAVRVELSARIAKLKEKIEAGSIDQDSLNNEEPSKTRCSFKLFGQIESSDIPQDLMEELESEIEKPTGISTVKPPELRLNAVLVSQDCGILYKIKDTVGLKSPQLYRKITSYAGLSTMVYLILLAFLSREIARINSTASLARVSRYVFLTQSLIDAIAFVGHITLAILADGRPSLSVLAPAGLACVMFIYEAQFAVVIGQVQAPEDAVPSPRPLAPATPPATENATGPTVTAPTPTPTTTPPPAPTNIPNQRLSFWRFLWNHIRTDPSARMWTTISLFLIFVFRIVLILSLPLFFVGSLYSFIWLVQIYRSVRRGRNSGLSVEYLFGATVCRLYFALYFLGCPKNILDVEPRRWIYGVAVFMFLQIGVILLQDVLGPTFFLGTRVATGKTYDYHPPMSLPDSESPEQTLGDCAICMDAIEVDPSLRRRSKSSDGKDRGDLLGLATGARRTGGILGAVGGVGQSRKHYSLAPCHHLFHTTCLERWLAIKNICPQCRRPLPPL